MWAFFFSTENCDLISCTNYGNKNQACHPGCIYPFPNFSANAWKSLAEATVPLRFSIGQDKEEEVERWIKIIQNRIKLIDFAVVSWRADALKICFKKWYSRFFFCAEKCGNQKWLYRANKVFPYMLIYLPCYAYTVNILLKLFVYKTGFFCCFPLRQGLRTLVE